MARLESSFKNMLLTLLAVTFVSSACVGSVYELTKGPLAETKRQRQIAAVREVLPGFDNNPVEEKYQVPTDNGELIFYPAEKDGHSVGTAVETFSDQGFGGRIRLMVGFLPEGAIHRITVLEHSETPGLGDKIDKKKSDFSQQFAGKDPAAFTLTVDKDGGDVDGITAATVSSRAFCDAVRRAVKALNQADRDIKPIEVEIQMGTNSL